MSEPFIGQICPVGFNFAPRGWALCNGQLLSIAQNTALFSLLGTTYGGDGITTFALPDLRGRVPVHQGQGPGLSSYDLGQVGGSETVTLTNAEIPGHTHLLAAFADAGGAVTPTGNFIAEPHDGFNPPYQGFNSVSNTTLNPASVSITGGGQPHNNLQPYLCVNFIIALEGIFPSRN